LIAKSSLGRILGGAILILALSPKARDIGRQFAIKGTEMVLDVRDQIRDAAAEIKSQLKLENNVIAVKDDLSKHALDTMNMEEH
jgi:hypothetical protein